MKRISLSSSWLLVLLATCVARGQEAPARAYVSPAVEHRIFFKPGDPILARLQSAGSVRHVEDYRSFILAIVDERLAGGRGALLSLGVPLRDDQAVIGINGAPLDTADREGLAARLASIPLFLRAGDAAPGKAQASSLWIVQFVGPIRDEWLGRLTSTGAVIVTPMATNGYVVRVDGESLPAFAGFEKDPAVQWLGSYQPFFRLNPELRALDFGRVTPVDVTIQLVAGESAFELVDTLGRAGFRVLRPTEQVLEYLNVRMAIPANLIPALAAHPAVFGIEPLPEVRMNDEAQGQIVAGNLNPGLSGPAAPGYFAWLATKGFSSSGQFNFAVDVTDDGIDRGSVTDVNDEFRVLGPGGASRVAYAYNYTSNATAESGFGHGNINASIVGGYDVLTGAAYQDANGYNYGLGICPFVQLGASKVFNNSGYGEFLASTTTRLAAAYAAGALFSSNSWAYTSGNDYNAESQAHDVVVRDASAAAGNQEMTIVFAAGNSGSSASTAHAPGTAKNVITVGASENNRQTGTDGCAIDNTGADNAMDIIGFSSRGPTSDGRMKPDIVGPGTHIQGAASRSLSYTGNGVCNAYWPAGQTLYAWSSGTSHSTPAIAGSSALVRQYFLNQGLPAPSPAMIKAYLMSSTRYMTGVGANDNLWSNSQGMGLVDLGRAFDNTPRVLIDETQVFGTTGQTYVVSGSVTSSASPFRVGLVWTDPPGPTTGNAFVNNLDLQVTINGTTYLGNVFSGPLSVPGGVADAKNNAEFVFLPAGTTGAFTITVVATNIAGDGVPGNADPTDQDFALVVYNGTTCTAVTINTQPVSQSVCPGAPASFSVAASGAGLSYQWRKNGSNIPGATGTSYAIQAVAAGDAGNYDVIVTGTCIVASSPAVLSVVIPPAITVDPAGGAACLGLPRTLSVTATGSALTYQWRKGGVDIVGATSSSYLIASVTPGDAASYDVVVTNACGVATSNPAVLVLGSPISIATQPSPVITCQGMPVSFSVSATGSAPISYQWQKNGANIAGANSATYTISPTVAADAGTYAVVVANGCGPLSSNGVTLTLQAPAGFATQPSGGALCQGQVKLFSVTTTGSAPLTGQWRKNGVPISGATSNVYIISGVTANDAGSYDIVVTNGCGPATSNAAILTVNSPPSIATQPASLTACLGAPASFSATPAGSGPFTYQWRRDGVAILGGWSQTYTIPSTLPGSAAGYSVIVMGACGPAATSSAGILTVGTAASITTQPIGQAVCAGDLVSLSVTAAGTGLSYQWRKNGAGIPGATSAAFSIPSASSGDSGSYDVVVTAACGPPVTSSAVSVLVSEPVISTLVPPSIGIMPPSFTPIPITVNGSCFLPGSVVYANGVPLSTTVTSPTSLSCLLGPSVPQAGLRGAICMNVQNTVTDVSNSVALVVGSGNNAGTIRRQPLAPPVGAAYSIVIEGGLPFAAFSLFADFGTVNPAGGFPNPASNLVLAVSPLTGSAGPLLTVFDGLGIFGPPSGTAFDASGKFVVPGLFVPNPPFGIAVTIQAVYLDPSIPAGFRLTWARFPEQI